MIRKRRLSALERDRLIETCARKYLDNPGYGLSSAVLKGIEETLPKEKHVRDWTEAQVAWKWLKAAVEQRIALLRDHEQAKVIEEVKPPSVVDFTTEVLIRELLNRFAPAVEGLIERAVANALRSKVVLTTGRRHDDDENDISNAQPPQRQPRKPKVVIIGLLHRQQQLIVKEFDKEFDLRFLKEESGYEKYVKHADYIIAFTSFTDHGRLERIKHFPGYINVSGGMTALRDKLTELYVQSEG